MTNLQKNQNSESAPKPSTRDESEMECHPSFTKRRRLNAEEPTMITGATDTKSNPTINGSTAQSVPQQIPSSSKASTSAKYANRYEPDKPLDSPEDIKAWRKAARRKRNRESAEKSRNKVRDRIIELENQVDDYKTRYEAVLEKIRRTEERISETHSIVSPLRSSSRIQEFGTVSPSSSTGEEPLITMRNVSTAPPFPSLVEFESSASPPTIVKEAAVVKVVNGVVKVEVVKLEDHQNVIEITSRPA